MNEKWPMPIAGALALSLLALGTRPMAAQSSSLKQESLTIDAFEVIGIRTQTSVQADRAGSPAIGELWHRFQAEQILAKIPGRIDKSTVAVYHDYVRTDAALPYKLLLGARVAPGTQPPPGMVLVKVPRQKYAKFTTRKGAIPGIIIDAWNQVWDLFNRSELNRAFGIDFELYDQRAADPRSAEVDLYISEK